MKQLYSIILLIFFPTIALGQLYSISDHQAYNSLSINPAFAGSQDALNTTIQYRNYITGFEGSPETMTLSVHSPLKYNRIGVGLLIMRDAIGITNETTFVGSYAYRLNLGAGKLALGMGFGFALNNTSWHQLQALDEDDEQLYGHYSSGILPDFSSGIYYSNSKFFLGLSIPFLINYDFDPKTEKYVGKSKFFEKNYFLNTGYFFYVHPDIQVFPAALLKYNQQNTQVDLNLQVILKNKIWLGTAYRSKNIIVGMLQYQVNNQLRVAYSYNFITGSGAEFNYNSNELMLNYAFNYKLKVSDPRIF